MAKTLFICKFRCVVFYFLFVNVLKNLLHCCFVVVYSSICIILSSCGSKKYTSSDGEVIFSTSSDLQIDERLAGVIVEAPSYIEDTCMLTTDFDYQNAGISMDSYQKIDVSDYKKYFSRSGDLDFYLHPIICDGKVYNVTNDAEVVAYQLHNRKVQKLWSEKILSSKEKKNILLSQARLDDGILYIATGNGWIIAFDVEKRQILWQRNLPEIFAASPTIYEDKLYVISASDELFALDKNTGEVAWQADEGRSDIVQKAFQKAPVAVFQGKIVAGFSNGNIIVANGNNGEYIWKSKVVQAQNASNITQNDICFPPILFNGVLVAGGLDTSVMGFDFKTGQALWQIPVGLNSYIFHNSDGFGFFVDKNNENVCFFIQNGAVKSVKPYPQIASQEMPRYMNNGKNIKTIPVNRYFDAVE